MSTSRVIDFLQIISNLKETKRTGWVLRGIKGPESVADHMYRMSVMALISEDNSNIDKNKCIKIAIAHDMAEAIVGDIAPSQGISKKEKHKLEVDAISKMCEQLGGSAGQEIFELWQEYEANETLEAKFVKDLDKIEMILQALEYEKAQGVKLQEFFDSTEGKFQTEIGKTWAAEIVQRRKFQ